MAPTKPEKPNILVILADQLRARTVGCYGDKQAKTPNIDALAERGVRFTSAYSTCPVCTPARASIQTGLMPTTCHVVWNNQTLEPKYPTFAELLAGQGYTCAYIGKWHLGGYEGAQGEDYRHPIKKSHRHGWNDLFLVTHGEDYRPGISHLLLLMTRQVCASQSGNRAGKQVRPWHFYRNRLMINRGYCN